MRVGEEKADPGPGVSRRNPESATVQYIVLEIGTAGAGSLISNIDQEINLKKIGDAARRREITVQFPKSVNFLGVSAVSRFPRPDFQGNVLYCIAEIGWEDGQSQSRDGSPVPVSLRYSACLG